MNNPLRIAFIGFRHGHIMGLYTAARKHSAVRVVAAAEDHAETVESLKRDGKVELTHDDWRNVIANVDCDAIAVGDYFGRRGLIIIAALKAGKHIIADKPICTKLNELDEIESLVTQQKRAIGCLLDLRDDGAYITARKLIREGQIGEVHTVIVTAQHPLFFGKRAGWYFEPGKHGGTLNDIGVHAIDMIPWLTGRKLDAVVAARAWNARVPQHPHFQDAAQFMLKLDNGGGVLGDMSYLTPDGIAYAAPQYWRLTCHGSEGVLETKLHSKTVQIATRNDKEMHSVPAEADAEDGCLEAFLADISGKKVDGALTTGDVLRATRQSLLTQQAADSERRDLPLR
jgi:predicted dehydrogenase